VKCALTTGVTGQGGAYLAEFLLHKDYDLHSPFNASMFRLNPRRK
jgi:GDP-D-mannose dehydratase